MKIQNLALALTALVLSAAPRAAQADEVSFQYFYDTLAPMGEWVQVGDYGDCWHPTGVDEDWAPYTDGYWSYTDAGWTWVSYEDFGGICYHYGRWVHTDEEGWCWVPDYEWGPAWVSWRNNDEAVGWAPLPPEAHWRASVGISTWCDDSYDIGPGCYTFCPVVDFGAPVIRSVCYPRSRNIFFIGRTVNITNITYNSYSNVIFCGGPNFLFINQHSHRPVPALKLVTNFNINRGVHGWNNARTVGNTLQVYAPKIVNNNTTIINKPKITKVINKTQVNNGWNGIKDQGERQKIRTQIKEQNHGLTADNAPAKPVKAEDLKHLPEKADPKAPSPIAGTGGHGKDRNGDGIPDNQEGKGGKGKGPNTVGTDRNGDGIPDNQEGKGGKGKGPNTVGTDRNGDGIPDNRGGKPGNGVGNGKGPKVGVDRNGDGIPDNQTGQETKNGKSPKSGIDRNGDGIPDNQPGNGVGNGKGPKNLGTDTNGDGIPDRPNRGQGGFQGGGEKKPKGQPDNGGFVPGGREGNGQPEKHERNAQQKQQIEQQQQQQQQRQIEKQQQQGEMQQRALENQRNQQIQRQQEMQHQRQQEVPRERPQQQQVVPHERPQQPQVPHERPQQPQAVPHGGGGQQQPQNNGGGGGQGKGQKQLTPEEAAALKKQHG